MRVLETHIITEEAIVKMMDSYTPVKLYIMGDGIFGVEIIKFHSHYNEITILNFYNSECQIYGKKWSIGHSKTKLQSVSMDCNYTYINFRFEVNGEPVNLKYYLGDLKL